MTSGSSRFESECSYLTSVECAIYSITKRLCRPAWSRTQDFHSWNRGSNPRRVIYEGLNMSTYDEKLRAIINSRQFLHDLLDPKKTPRVPKVVRQTAHRVCRHLPFPCELEDLFEDKNHADRV